ncbi:MAG: pre-peptidase C-terminal domain-containing protein [Clostridia bacterium]|nr:pre-peptidase C-terminal domain-containing protein [Clostridia bacterium]
MKKVKSALALLLAALMFAGCFATASAAKIEEAEPNNAADTATVFEIGKKIEGTLGSADDVDCYKFEAAKTGLATVAFEHAAVAAAEASVTYFTVTAYNAATQTAVSEITSAGSSTSDKAEFIVMAGEEYIVAVKKGMVYDGTVGYSVTVTVDESIASESEPNDTFDKANKFELSVSGNAKYYYGAIAEGNKDLFKITVPSNGVLNLYLYNEFSPKGNFTARLLAFEEDANGAQAAREVTSIAVTDKEESKVGPSVCVAAGDYLLEISGETGSYKTRVLFRAAANTETENNDSSLLADEIKIGTAYKATLDEKADKDYFQFVVPAGNKGYDITFTATNSAKWNVRLLNSDSVAVADTLKVNATDGNKTAKLETYPLDAGTYYIEVTAGEEKFDSDIYEIKVTEKTASIEPEKPKSLIDRIKELNWGALADNLAGWFEQIDLMGLISDIIKSISMVFAMFG